ncbi:hypothetical protein [Marinimicrobium agarilyticum]|uniref:hypothetical protein n=1 Tax=Marinimicrobium agarilyticum TaxID=306546 RepID=UPI0004208210|nr:hypothetical protein [Marinimicrobium agarilyticum]
MERLWFSMTLVLLTAYSSAEPTQDTFQKEAEAFCQVHSIDYWKGNGRLEPLNELSPTEKQSRLNREIRSTINSKEMERVIYEEAQTLSADEFYPYLQREVPKLTGRPFKCPAIKAFYLAR